MPEEEVGFIKCQFSKGGVPSELTFHLHAPRGGRFAGIAPVEYCRGKDSKPLQGDIPRGQRVEGLIAGIVLGSAEEANVIRVYLPDGEIYEIDRDLIEKEGRLTHVPLKSRY